MAFSIGFSNFRQFKHFPAISLKDITILVGCNNAGKSTLVKALLLMGDFFRNGDCISGWYNARLAAHAEDTKKDIALSITEGKTPRFYFDRLYAAHIGTFYRALCNHADADAITFEYSDKKIKLELTIESDSKDERATSAPITQARITDLQHNIQYSCNYTQRQITVVFNSAPLAGYEDGNLQEYFAAVPTNATIQIPLTFNALNRDKDFKGILSYLGTCFDATIGEGNDYMGERTRKRMAIPNLPDNMLQFLKTQKSIYDPYRLSTVLQFAPGAEGDEIEYIYAHAISQNVVYSTKDSSNDYVSKTVHEFAEPAVQAHESTRPFVREWLKKFNIGDDYEIISIGGEAHVVNIISADGSKVNMADKGMGAIQLIILLFRIAKIMTTKLVDTEPKLIVIEEPEQNLHPSIQSKLADFFYIMNRDHHFRFIVETHSEYLVRKTQVLVRRDKLEENGNKNPFLVYYFDGRNTEQPYYEMEYQPDGAFANDFGEGFFDEASNLAFEIL